MKPCAHCQTPFTPQRMGQRVCSPRCAGRLVKEQKKAEIATTRARKQALKTIPQLIKEAQVEFNKFIRARDEGKPCICCGRFAVGDYGAGHGWDCGHYRSTGSASHLRFNENNAHRQLVVCNRHGAGRAVDYRIGLIARIGRDAVEVLENDNRVHRWTREELETVKSYYNTKLKALQATRTT